jgi:iron complex transport system ATP-binding protein
VIGEIPFSQITTDSHKANIELIKRANFVIVTDFQVGPGNLKNIEAAAIALDSEVPVVVIDSTPLTNKDFIGGKLEKHFDQLRKNKAKFVKNPEGALNIILKEVSI